MTGVLFIKYVVVPSVYRQHVLKHFFWPGLKTDVAEYCPSCHVCQITGKPNQVIPLHPIPAIGELFERVIVDCVGPLPTKSGNQFLLTMMCAAICFPKAVLLRKITPGSVIKALTKFFSTLGLPHIIQTDQGTNYKSKLFKSPQNPKCSTCCFQCLPS